MTQGASVSSSIHPTALVETASIGAGCVVAEYASLGADVVLSEDVEVGAGARLVGRVEIGTSATIGANAVVGASDGAGVIIGRSVRIGANVTVAPGVTIGRGAAVDPGSSVETDVPAHAVVRGVPASIVGYVDTPPEPTEEEIVESPDLDAPQATRVPGVVLYPLTTARDLRGSLAALEFQSLPFVPRRVFAVHGVPDESVRGAHAHRACAQLLVCLSGELSCVADDGETRQEFRLTSPGTGLLVPPLVWAMQYRYTRDATLLVLAELPYDPDDYIRDYEEFLGLVAARREPA
jgi:UDP-2-acetamido-3-amino-2,3-dideoxy-glucuronate N-acetyltransferase